ncbi:hypothetical protein DFH09DRAFT_1078732 [Mycena vulgaris]|nr:hypothetical protein DFH09DRAFT_1078732 [Mycena vulgaris]
MHGLVQWLRRYEARELRLEKPKFASLLPIYRKELTKPFPERCIHSYIETKKGKIIIVTFVPYLLKLLNDFRVTSFDRDTTYKGVEGKLNEWELTIFAKVVQHAASLLCAYINGASTDFFKQLFNELQHVKLMAMGKLIPLKRFVRGSNLLATNVDMNGAQVLGLCCLVMEYNDPEYSSIPNDTPPEEITSEFIKLCWRHGNEPIHDFKSLVSPEQLARIKDIFYIDSKKLLVEFSSFVYGLGVKKITDVDPLDWRKHKEMHDWIIPCLVKSQSHISADIWDSTPSKTNTNEVQHHWINSLTGIKLTLVEVLEKLMRTLRRRWGILSNPNNELSHHMVHNNQRQSAATCRACESHEKAVKGPSDAPVQPAQFRLENSLTPTVLTTPTTQSEEQLMPANSVQPPVDPAFYFDFDFDSLLASLETCPSFFAQDTSSTQLSTYDRTFDPAVFSLPGRDFNVLMPSNSSAPTTDLLDKFMTMDSRTCHLMLLFPILFWVHHPTTNYPYCLYLHPSHRQPPLPLSSTHQNLSRGHAVFEKRLMKQTLSI